MCNPSLTKSLLPLIDPTVSGSMPAYEQWLNFTGQANLNTFGDDIDRYVNVQERCPDNNTHFTTFSTSTSVPSYLDANGGCSLPTKRNAGAYAFDCNSLPSNPNRRRLNNCYCSPASGAT